MRCHRCKRWKWFRTNAWKWAHEWLGFDIQAPHLMLCNKCLNEFAADLGKLSSHRDRG